MGVLTKGNIEDKLKLAFEIYDFNVRRADFDDFDDFEEAADQIIFFVFFRKTATSRLKRPR
jgi:hypothetical protein